MSKNFDKDEVLGYTEVDGRKVTVLKPGVVRLRYNTHIPNDNYFEQMDQALIHLERWTDYYKKVMGEEHFEGDE